jgi:hypothetical protein
MRKPNYRFERAERDRAKRPKTMRSCSGGRKGPLPTPATALPKRPQRTSRGKPDPRPPVSHSVAAALMSRLQLRAERGTTTRLGSPRRRFRTRFRPAM